ncbi:toll-like receptor Tollo isoform X3 [Varroa destructor]|uniref:TIR domain-containing protein n=1 Tax=Varroa destructor TaxID=109461 RepID=A0A7M7KF17_VARDE|nr:toll-like receptor Tollo isoform X3 [Varroa destructor]
MLSCKSLWCDLEVTSSSSRHARLPQRGCLTGTAIRRWVFVTLLLSSVLSWLLHETLAQHCLESNLVYFPGFKCCKEPLDSESGWRWICFRDGELPMEPPDPPETTSAKPNLTPLWTTTTLMPPAVDVLVTSAVTSPAMDTSRTSKAVKVNSTSTATSESIDTTTPIPQGTTIAVDRFATTKDPSINISLPSTTLINLAASTPEGSAFTPPEISTASFPGTEFLIVETTIPTDLTKVTPQTNKALTESKIDDTTSAHEITGNAAEENKDQDDGIRTGTAQILTFSTDVTNSIESTTPSFITTPAQSESSYPVTLKSSQPQATSPKAIFLNTEDSMLALIMTTSISTMYTLNKTEIVKEIIASNPLTTISTTIAPITSPSFTTHNPNSTFKPNQDKPGRVMVSAENSTVSPTGLPESIATVSIMNPISSAVTAATTDSDAKASGLRAPTVVGANTTPQPTAMSGPSKLTTSTIARELRISATTLVQHSTTPKPRFRRDANSFPIDEFLRKTGLEETQSALEIEYAKRPYGSHVTIDCNAEKFIAQPAPNVRGLFKYLNIKDVTSIKYIHCNLPTGRLKFVNIFEGNMRNITKLELDRPRTPGGPPAPSAFDGIATSIVELHIIWSANRDAPGITSLSDDFFKDFASLTALSLKANALESMPLSVNLLKKLKTLDISMNLITTVTSSMFAGLEALTTLYLAKNPIARFESKPFASLRYLTTLELNAVQASEVPENLFEGLSSLTYLKMDSWSNLKSVPPKLFAGTPSLETLHFSEAMSIGSLPDGLFDRMFQLNATYVRSCNLSSVPAKLFANAPVIRIIDFSGNALSEFPEGFFLENAKLEKIFFGGNRIRTLRNEFEMLYALKELNLNRNHLTEISSKAFENLISLQTLDISRNRISKIEKNALYHLKKLEKLDIRENQLQTFGGTTPTFSTGSPIREVYLSKNELTAFPWIQYHTLPKLSILDLDDNAIRYLEVPLFASLDTKVFVRRNRLEYVTVDLARSYPKQESVYNSAVGTHRFDLEGNPFKCDCHIYNFLRYLRKEMKPEVAEFEHVENYQCSDRDETLLSVKLDLLSCKINDCPPGCECFLRAHDASTHVRCRELGLASIPKLPLNVTHLDFEGNVLKRYPTELAQYTHLKEIMLDGNNIDNIDELFINTPPNLQLLSLTGNRLEVLRPITSNTSYRMALSHNPWTCDCSALEFKRFLLSNILNIPDYRSITCKNAYTVNGTDVSLLNDIPDDIFCPPDVSAYLASVIALSIIFIVTLLIIALYYNNRQLIIAYVYINFYNVFVCLFSESDLDEDKKFDAFISYSSNDRDIVMALLQELEKPQGDESSENLFKLCIHERDWLPGYNISWNIVNSVQNSRRTILVLSQDFLESLWFEVEFRTAYVQMMEDRINRLIVIIKGEIPPKENLDSDLRFLLGTKTYLEWGEKWFWEKLKYAMPHKGNIGGPLKNKIKPSELHKVLPMSVLTSKHQVPNLETVVRVEDAIENAQSNKAAKQSSPDDSTYGSMSESLAHDTSTAKMGHVNRGYEPVSTEDIHLICADPDPAGVIAQPKPAPRSARKKEAHQLQPITDASPPKNSPDLTPSHFKPSPVKSARVRHTTFKSEAQ